MMHMRTSDLRVLRLCSVRMLTTMLMAAAAVGTLAQGTPKFTGLWKQDNGRCQPKRNGDVTLRIEHHGQKLTVETSISGLSTAPRHAIQKYTTDGKVSASTGPDGDVFYTSAVCKDTKLVFSIEEHEDGRILPSKEIWSVNQNGATLERVRDRQNNERQILFYRRIPIDGTDGGDSRRQ